MVFVARRVLTSLFRVSGFILLYLLDLLLDLHLISQFLFFLNAVEILEGFLEVEHEVMDIFCSSRDDNQVVGNEDLALAASAVAIMEKVKFVDKVV